MNHGSSWLRAYPTSNGSRCQLVIFPHAGGGTAEFASWATALGPDVRTHVLSLPGRERRFREPPATRLEDVVEPVTAAVSALEVRPTVFVGHSMGAVVAFEVARLLRRTGRALPSLLILSGRIAPDRTNHAARLSHLPDGELAQRAAELYGGLPSSGLDDAELVQLMMGSLRADLAMLESYVYSVEPALACPIVAVAGSDDPLATWSDVIAWQAQTCEPLTAAQYPGGHFYFRMPANRDRFIAMLRECCDAAATGRAVALESAPLQKG